MAGPNQHHIPVFYQKGFAIPKSRAREIWVFNRDAEPEIGLIKKTGSDDYFYSEPSADGSATLDDKITEIEVSLSTHLRGIREQEIGDKVDAEKAATIIMHLSSRTSHLRGTMETGMRQLAEGASSMFDDPDNLATMIGLDQSEPSSRFNDHFWKEAQKFVDEKDLTVPKDLVEKIAFFLARENFATALGDALPTFTGMFHSWLEQSPSMARESHNEVLSRFSSDNDPNPRQKYLAELDWSIAEAPSNVAILPDCVVISISADGTASPFMHIDRDDTTCVVMPLSSRKLLIGKVSASAMPELTLFNQMAARSCYDFFLSSSDEKTISQLHPLIGERATLVIDKAIDSAFSEYMPQKPETLDADEPLAPEQADNARCDFSYQLTLTDFGDQETADKLGMQIKSIIAPLAQVLPLHRLEGISFAYDYPAALNAVERGYDNARPVETMDESIGKGIAKLVPVKREDEVKGWLVFDILVFDALTNGDQKQAEWAIHIIVGRLVLVAMMEWIEAALPGTQLQPVKNEYDGWLYESLDAPLSAYVASYISSGFGDVEEIAETSRQMLCDALGRIKGIVLPARLEYRYSRDLDALLGTTMPVMQHILMFSADLLGHCGASDVSAFDDDGKLSNALTENGLEKSFPLFQNDLEKFRKRLGEWESFDEFLSLGIHVERLLWQVGMIPWYSKDTGMRVEIPLESDAEELMKDQ